MRSETRVHRLRLEGKDAEHTLVDAPQRFPAGQPIERLQTERVLAQG
jgi:hypothetical protein